MIGKYLSVNTSTSLKEQLQAIDIKIHVIHSTHTAAWHFKNPRTVILDAMERNVKIMSADPIALYA